LKVWIVSYFFKTCTMNVPLPKNKVIRVQPNVYILIALDCTRAIFCLNCPSVKMLQWWICKLVEPSSQQSNNAVLFDWYTVTIEQSTCYPTGQIYWACYCEMFSTAIKLCKTRRTQTTTCTGVSPICNINQRTCRFQTWPRYGEALYSMNESLLTLPL